MGEYGDKGFEGPIGRKGFPGPKGTFKRLIWNVRNEEKKTNNEVFSASE